MALITVETAPAYVVEQLKDGVAYNKAEEIVGGNLNYAFKVSAENGKDVFLKQAPGFIKVIPDMKLHRERLELEMNAYKEWKRIIGEEAAKKYLPEVYKVDLDKMACIMEFLGSYRDLFDLLWDGEISEKVAVGVGEFMALAHSKSHSTIIAAAEVQRLTGAFKNPLRELQLEFVLTKAFVESDRAASWREDKALMAEIEGLKSKYKGENTKDLSLVQGDFHPGSAMAAGDSVKVIDPEFAIYGPPGCDVGCMVSGYVLAYVFHLTTGSGKATAVLSAIGKMWAVYKTAAQAGGISAETLAGISEDAVGFASCEVARTVLGFAGVRGLPIKDEAAKARAEDVALGLAKRCIEGRKGKGMDFMMEELRKLALAYPGESRLATIFGSQCANCHIQ